MARVFNCPRCGKPHAGVSHSKGSTSVVCTLCVPIPTVPPLVDASPTGGNYRAKRRTRKKVSK